jgi:hypothetical protein
MLGRLVSYLISNKTNTLKRRASGLRLLISAKIMLPLAAAGRVRST